MNHVEVDYHLVQDRVVKKLLDVQFISTEDQVADGFTKALSQDRPVEFQCNLNLIKLLLRGMIEYLEHVTMYLTESWSYVIHRPNVPY
jgi:hypothetical protein